MPSSFLSLYELFEVTKENSQEISKKSNQALETACAFLERRDQLCVFDKLQITVQELSKK